MSDYPFRVRHAGKQKLILRALNEMRSEAETQAETQAVIDMIHELEGLLAQRQRHHKLHMERWKAPRSADDLKRPA